MSDGCLIIYGIGPENNGNNVFKRLKAHKIYYSFYQIYYTAAHVLLLQRNRNTNFYLKEKTIYLTIQSVSDSYFNISFNMSNLYVICRKVLFDTKVARFAY